MATKKAEKKTEKAPKTGKAKTEKAVREAKPKSVVDRSILH